VNGAIRGTDSLLLTGLASNVGTKALRYNPSTGIVTYADTTAGGGITGTGTTNYIPKWSSSTALGNSEIYDNGTTAELTIGYDSTKTGKLIVRSNATGFLGTSQEWRTATNDSVRMSFGDVSSSDAGPALKIMGVRGRSQNVELALVQNEGGLRTYGGYFDIKPTSSDLTWTRRVNNVDNVALTIGNSSGDVSLNNALSVGSTGAFGDNVTMTKNIDGTTKLQVVNTSSGSSAAAQISLQGNGATTSLARYSSNVGAYKILAPNDFHIYNPTVGDINILNDWASGSINMASGALSAAQFSIQPTKVLIQSSTSGYNFQNDPAASTFFSIFGKSVTPSSTNGSLRLSNDGTASYLNSTSSTGIQLNGVNKIIATSTGVAMAGTSTTGNDLSITNSTLTTGSAASITLTGTAAASNTKTGLAITSSGANATASQTVTGQTISVTNTGTTNTNVGLNVSASGGSTNNTALLASAGNVVIGQNTLGYPFEIYGTSNFTFGFSKDVTALSSLGSDAAVRIINKGGTASLWLTCLGNTNSALTTGSTNLVFGTADAERMRLNSTGLGIGTTSPDSLLTVNTSANIKTNLRVQGTITLTDGANKSVGQATLASGTVTVNNTRVTANSRIFLTLANCSTCGTLYVGTITAATSFVINSTNVLDGSLVNWIIIN